MTAEPLPPNYKIGNERLISVTEKAASKLASLLEEKGKPDGALRLKVVGGGCSGLQYVMDLVDGPKERDILVPTQNVHLVVDPKSALFGSITSRTFEIGTRISRSFGPSTRSMTYCRPEHPPPMTARRNAPSGLPFSSSNDANLRAAFSVTLMSRSLPIL